MPTITELREWEAALAAAVPLQLDELRRREECAQAAQAALEAHIFTKPEAHVGRHGIASGVISSPTPTILLDEVMRGDFHFDELKRAVTVATSEAGQQRNRCHDTARLLAEIRGELSRLGAA